MLNCIVGALLCSMSANITIDGPLAYAQPVQTSYAWNYAAYSYVPTRAPFFGIFGRSRS
jgi:hypothetical protein